jgi:hypothetical protein
VNTRVLIEMYEFESRWVEISCWRISDEAALDAWLEWEAMRVEVGS